jgi:hypothetical protein
MTLNNALEHAIASHSYIQSFRHLGTDWRMALRKADSLVRHLKSMAYDEGQIASVADQLTETSQTEGLRTRKSTP